MSKFYQILKGSILEVSESNKCPHCNKPDWCYRLGDDLSVCNRSAEPASGWYKTQATDKNNKPYYARENKKKTRKPSRQTWEYLDRDGNRFVQVVRVTPGKQYADGTRKDKDIFQQQWNGSKWISSLKGVDRAEIPIYRYKEVRGAIAQGIPIVIAEGETCVDALWALDIPATCNIGGSGKWKASDSKDLEGAKIIIAPDRDIPGVNHALKIAEDFPDAQWLYCPPSSFFWQTKHLPESKGLDVGDYIDDYKPSKETVLNLIHPDSPSELNKNLRELYPKKSTKHDKPSLELELESTINVEQPVTLKAQDALFSDGEYIAIKDKLYRWDETHYKPCNQAYEKRRITEWCKSTPVHTSGNKYEYKWAKTATIEEIWKWILLDFGVGAEQLNPPGLPCLNGVLKIEYLGKTPIPTLKPHNPNEYYTYCAQIEYNPHAPEQDCNNLLKALDDAAQTIFLRTISASLNLGYVREQLGRGVKALLCQGTGSNGKDTLREAVAVLFGEQMSNASVTDFRQYDQGRKFSIAKLEGSRINWASENSSFANIDNLQGLKQAITGESIDIEPKNQPEYQYTPETVFFFNVNEPPLLSGGMDAIKDRYAILKFKKTFKINANTDLGELEADPRFRYDPNFLRDCVCPALLNKIMAQLPLLLDQGIDYSSCQADMEEWQRETNHLWQFTQETGLEYSPGSKVYVSDLWAELKNWYIENEMLFVGESYTGQEILQFGEPSRKGDSLIKASNQLFNRFSKLFPKIERGQESGHHPRKKARYFLNLTFSSEDVDFRNGTRAIREEILREREDKKTKFTEGRARMLIESLDSEERDIFLIEMKKRHSHSSHPDSVKDRVVPHPVPTSYPNPSKAVPDTNKPVNVDNKIDSQSTSTQSAVHAPLNLSVNWTQNTLTIKDTNLTANENSVSTSCEKDRSKKVVRVQLPSGEFAKVIEQQDKQIKAQIEGSKTIREVNLEDCRMVLNGEPEPEQLTIL